MKKLNFFLTLILCSLFIVSCGDDDEIKNGEDVSGNFLKIEGESQPLKWGGIQYYGTWETEEMHNFDLVLATTKMEMMDGEFVPEDNIFNGIYFEMWTENPDDIQEGTYLLNDTEGAFTYSYGEVVINYNYSTETGNYEYISEGALEVLQNGNIYEFSFQGLTITGKEVSLYYKGVMSQEDYSKSGRPASIARKQLFSKE